MAEFGGVAGDQLQSVVERIERLEDEKKELTEQIRGVFQEAKSAGFDIKILRQILKLRRMQEHDRAEQEQLLELYKSALGMR
jgi:uncharacterized protein (UPF0335 family)